MRVRRAHRKSRSGCKLCKSRRMKCDEMHPVCGNCQKFELECDFAATNDKDSTPPPPMKVSPLRDSLNATALSNTASFSRSNSEVRSKKSRLPRKTTSIESTASTVDETFFEPPKVNLLSPRMNTPTDRLLELKLMHHFVTTGSTTFFQLIGSYNALQTHPKIDTFAQYLIDLSMQNHGLMDALLGFSAFTLRHQDPTNRVLSYTSHHYLKRAIAAHTSQLQQGIHSKNAELIFAGSSILSFIIIGSYQYLTPNNTPTLPLHWFQPWQGLRTLVQTSWFYYNTPALTALLTRERGGFEAPTNTVNHFSFLLSGLESVDTSPEELHSYYKSVQWLSRIYENPGLDYVFKFTSKSSPAFVKMLERDDPRTLTIVGYWFMLLKILESEWWVPVPSKGQFEVLMGKLPVQGEWRERMKWAAEAFEGNGGDG